MRLTLLKNLNVLALLQAKPRHFVIIITHRKTKLTENLSIR
jgi:ATP:corrinoid adenosyltransferase